MKQGKMWLLGAVVGVSLVMLAGLSGDLTLALLVPLGGLLAYGLLSQPPRRLAHALLLVALVVDNTSERPGRNLYKSFSFSAGTLLYEPLSKSLHLPGVKLTGLECLILWLAWLVLTRRRAIDRNGQQTMAHVGVPGVFVRSCLVAMFTLLVLEGYGILTGGDVPHSLYQLRAMFFVPLLSLVFAYSFKDHFDADSVMGIVITAAVVRALMCIYYYFTVVHLDFLINGGGGSEGDGSYVTTHSDAILAAVAIVVVFCRFYLQPNWRRGFDLLWIGALVGFGIVLNNRRIAFVSVLLGIYFCTMAAKGLFRKRIVLTIRYSLPFLLLYVVAGWSAQGGWAKPVKTLRSVLLQKDTSSATRDVENYNLLQTLKVHPFIGFGYGHEYIEKVVAFDISKIFPGYRYVPHNSILWFLGVGGLLGYVCYWGFLVVGVFFAGRLLSISQHPSEMLMGMTAISACTAYLTQCYGDMGLMSWMGGLLVSSCLGCCAALVRRQELMSLSAPDLAVPHAHQKGRA